jgi:hypothetical protein
LSVTWSLILLVLLIFGVHTWNTPFALLIPHRLSAILDPN